MSLTGLIEILLILRIDKTIFNIRKTTLRICKMAGFARLSLASNLH